MRRFALLILAPLVVAVSVMLFGAGVGGRAPDALDDAASVRFTAIHIYVDTTSHPLAAYQLDFAATAGQVRIVGIEGGEHPAFQNPPYYDPRAMQDDRVIVAALSTLAGDHLPVGRTRLATIHIRISGDTEPTFSGQLSACAGPDGRPIEATISLETGTES